MESRLTILNCLLKVCEFTSSSLNQSQHVLQTDLKSSIRMCYLDNICGTIKIVINKPGDESLTWLFSQVWESLVWFPRYATNFPLFLLFHHVELNHSWRKIGLFNLFFFLRLKEWDHEYNAAHLFWGEKRVIQITGNFLTGESHTYLEVFSKVIYILINMNCITKVSTAVN